MPLCNLKPFEPAGGLAGVPVIRSKPGPLEIGGRLFHIRDLQFWIQRNFDLRSIIQHFRACKGALKVQSSDCVDL